MSLINRIHNLIIGINLSVHLDAAFAEPVCITFIKQLIGDKTSMLISRWADKTTTRTCAHTSARVRYASFSIRLISPCSLLRA